MVDEQGRELLRDDGFRISAQPKVFDLLVYLLRHRNRVVSREEMLRAIWSEITVGPDSITRALGEIRKLLRDRDLIRTYPGRGVRFVGEVAELSVPAPGAEPPPRFIAEQAAIERILQRGLQQRGGICVVLGPAGSGRTTLLETAQSRARVLGLETIWSTEIADSVRVAFARDKPVVLLHDDVHRAAQIWDVGGLATAAARKPVIMIVTCSSSSGRDPLVAALLASATRFDPEAVISLQPLDKLALSRIAENILGRVPSAAGIAKLLAATGGNPRLVQQVLQITHQQRRPLETLDRLSRHICERLHHLILGDVHTLGTDARSLLDAVSILEEPFTTEMAADIAELTPCRAADALAEAALAGVVTQSQTRWNFAQGVVRCVLQRDLVPSRRAMFHARAGVALERSLGTPPSQIEAIARHYVAGARVAHAPRAMELCRRVADAAIESHEFARAATWLGSALDIEATLTPAEPMRRHELWIALARTMSRDGQMDRAAEAFSAAESLVTPPDDALRRAFRTIAPVLPQIVERFYALLFERHPQLRTMFHRSAPLQQRMFGEKIASIAERGDDPDWLRAHLQALGRRHAEYGVTPEMYGWARAAFFEAVSDAMSPRVLCPEVRATWESTFDAMATTMQSLAQDPTAHNAA